MDREHMEKLIEAHLLAEWKRDVPGCVAVCTDDVELDVVGLPLGAARGKQEVIVFYENVARDIRTEHMIPVRCYYGDDFCITEHEWAGTLSRSLLGSGLRLSLRVLRVWEFRDGLISRANAWFDTGSLVHQLTGGHRVQRTVFS